MDGLDYNKKLTMETGINNHKRINAFDENINQFDLKYMNENEFIDNENSYTLFDKSLQDDSVNPSFVDQMISHGNNNI